MTYNRAVTLCKQMAAVKLNPAGTQRLPPAWPCCAILLSLGNIMIRIQRIYLEMLLSPPYFRCDGHYFFRFRCGRTI
jgi:hypothetical protein